MAPRLFLVTVADPRPARIPLSFAQQRMWFINRLTRRRHLQHPRRPALDRRWSERKRAECHRRTGRGCVAAGRDRRPRTPRGPSAPRSLAENGIPFQRVGDIAEFDDRRIWQIADSVDGVIAAATTGFDVTNAVADRVRLAQADSAGQEYLLAVVAHHIGLDGESMPRW